jgi:hypothetical protein
MTLRTVGMLKGVRTGEVFQMIANTPIQAVLPASDLERARGWYHEKLGLQPVSTNPFGDLRYEAGGSSSSSISLRSPEPTRQRQPD